MNSSQTQNFKVVNVDPSGLGLFGLAMVTLVASSAKLGITSGTSLIIPWAIFLGGFAQLFACFNDSKRENLFGTTVFGAYAFFWFSVAATWMIQNGVFGEAMKAGVDTKQIGFAFVGYLIFSLCMTIGSLETNKLLIIIFVLIDALFLGLSLSTFGIAKEMMHGLAAYSELLISLFSFYGSAAVVLNGHFGREFLPLGKPLGIFKNVNAETAKKQMKSA